MAAILSRKGLVNKESKAVFKNNTESFPQHSWATRPIVPEI